MYVLSEHLDIDCARDSKETKKMKKQNKRDMNEKQTNTFAKIVDLICKKWNSIHTHTPFIAEKKNINNSRLNKRNVSHFYDQWRTLCTICIERYQHIWSAISVGYGGNCHYHSVHPESTEMALQIDGHRMTLLI